MNFRARHSLGLLLRECAEVGGCALSRGVVIVNGDVH